MKGRVKIIVENDSESSKTLYLEPWGEDYGMNPKDKFEVVENQATENFHSILFAIKTFWFGLKDRTTLTREFIKMVKNYYADIIGNELPNHTCNSRFAR